MFSPSPSQSDASFVGKGSFNSLNSRRRPRPTHQTQPSISATLSAHPPKKPRQRSVSAQRQLNASPEAQAVVAASAGAFDSITKQHNNERKGIANEWAKNDKYCVTQLAAIPMELRDRGDNLARRMVATTDQTTGSILLIKDSGAYVWKYDEAHPLPKPDHFPLPPDETRTADGTVPLALGTLVAPIANSDEPGFVAIMPFTGRIAYWDAVSSAIAEGLFTKRRGVEGKVDLSVNESVQSICNIEPAGFVLCMSTGRLAHLALRDATGKPVVMVTNMRNYGAGMSGIFGGFANAFKPGGAKREVVAVRPGRIINRSERELLVATSRGQITHWEINRGGTAVIIMDVDMRDQMINRVIAIGGSTLANRDRELFTVLDVVTTYTTPDEPLEIMVLTAFRRSLEQPDVVDYNLVLLSFSLGKCNVKSVFPIHCYKSPLLSSSDIRPRIYLPMPARTAFVVFPKAIVVKTIIPEDRYEPSFDEAMEEEYDPSKGFEDVIDFRSDVSVEIVGSGYEDVTDDPSTRDASYAGSFDTSKGSRKKIYSPGVLIITKGAGVLRCNVFDAEPMDKRPKPSANPVPIKMKLEMAVFYGSKDKNLLNFGGRPEVVYPIEQVQKAAREVSKDILSSRCRYLPNMSPSIEAGLNLRIKMLEKLAQHLKTVFAPLNRDTKWKMCWDAEKLNAARAMFEVYKDRLKEERDVGQDVLTDAITAQLNSHQAINDPDDVVRDWFTEHILSIWELLPFARVAIEKTYGKDETFISRRINEASSMVLSVLITAYEFRVANVGLYGLEDDVNNNNIPMFKGLATGPWTSGPEVLTMLGRQVEYTDKLLDNIPMRNPSDREAFINSTTDQLVDLVEVSSRCYVERANWCESLPEGQDRNSGEEVYERYIKSRTAWMRALDRRDRASQALDIAEKYDDYHTLVELSFKEILKWSLLLEDPAPELSDKASLQKRKDNVNDRILGYFQRFGREFAVTLYQYQIDEGNLQELLIQYPAYKRYLQDFLHSSPQYAKLSWINDVANNEYMSASHTLMQVADEETDLWCKTVEISISKLAFMVGKNEQQLVELTSKFDKQINLVDMQNLFYAYLYPEIRGAIDNQAGTELAVSAWGGALHDRPLLLSYFKRGLAKLVAREVIDPVTLIDLLTLKSADDENYLTGAASDWPGEFCLALQVLATTDLDNTRKSEAEKAIWRRAWLRDDWKHILEIAGNSSDDLPTLIDGTSIFQLLTFGISRGFFQDDSPLRPIIPANAQFTYTLEQLASNFPDSTSASVESLLLDLKQENDSLLHMINTAKIDTWFDGIISAASKYVEDASMIEHNSAENSLISAEYEDGDMMDTD